MCGDPSEGRLGDYPKVGFDEQGRPHCYYCGHTKFRETATGPVSACAKCGHLFDSVQLRDDKCYYLTLKNEKYVPQFKSAKIINDDPMSKFKEWLRLEHDTAERKSTKIMPGSAGWDGSDYNKTVFMRLCEREMALKQVAEKMEQMGL